MAEITGIMTAIATCTLALVGVGGLVHPAISKKRGTSEMRPQERSPIERVETVNIERFGNTDVVTILVRNRSHIPVNLYVPVFEIRGVRNKLPGSMIQEAKLSPRQAAEFQLRF